MCREYIGPISIGPISIGSINIGPINIGSIRIGSIGRRRHRTGLYEGYRKRGKEVE